MLGLIRQGHGGRKAHLTHVCGHVHSFPQVLSPWPSTGFHRRNLACRPLLGATGRKFKAMSRARKEPPTASPYHSAAAGPASKSHHHALA